MRGNNILGIVFSNMHDEKIRELTEKRAMGSVPFGGRYRLIDFPLSNMVNSGINKVGVITKSNYQSLMDHLGSGKAWDLSRKREGLFILPPFGREASNTDSRIELLSSISSFLRNSNEEFVALSDCDILCSINFSSVLSFHLQHDADITIVYRHGRIPLDMADPAVYTVGPDGRILDMLISPRTDGACDFGMSVLLIRRELLMCLVDDCISRNQYHFERDLLQRNLAKYKVCGYQYTGYMRLIGSVQSYFEANMSLMLQEVREQLFAKDRPVFTKVRDDMPARYGLGASVSNSIIADGCVVDGTVENCVLFRGVKVGRGTVLRNCVIMQDGAIGAGCQLSYVIADKDVDIKNERSLMGFQSYPVLISKGAVV
ncbi:glucose-1-phosphate adenylyltransferase subunit GlgD [Hydrogeniiclostridium mannosilyticum]|uniref:glucose-1-phosphate adenylyltransferase subunit GlgD n=1 Tax=Hydrogeniiclostridium mannosilyticum TaxID=2764322 RepID=UPI00399B94E9